MWCPYITKKINYKKIIFVIIVFGGFNSVLSPIHNHDILLVLNLAIH
jgi:hypothetical protein